MATRFRKMFKFWLDLDKDDEYELAEEIATLRKNRQFAPTLRNGLRLILELQRGETSLLFEMFPNLKAKISEPGGNTGGQKQTDHTLDPALKIQLERLEHLILKQDNRPIEKPSKPVVMQPPPQITVKKAESSGNSAQNFLNSMAMFD